MIFYQNYIKHDILRQNINHIKQSLCYEASLHDFLHHEHYLPVGTRS